MAPIVTDTENSLDKVVLKSVDGDTCEIYLHGGHVVSWKTPAGEDIIFTSKEAVFKPPKAIRGGVPICFPQFGNLGPLSVQHGFARNTKFEVLEGSDDWTATLVMKHTGDGQDYPHPFELRTTVSLCTHSYAQDLTVTNTGSEAFGFTTALHTYYKISSVATTRVEGLKGTAYLDSLDGRKEKQEEPDSLVFDKEVDRIYLQAPDELKIVDEGAGRTITVQKVNFPDAVVWNPWVDKAKGMADFGDEEYKEMLCIEPAVASSGPITLAPGESWTGRQLITYS